MVLAGVATLSMLVLILLILSVVAGDAEAGRNAR